MKQIVITLVLFLTLSNAKAQGITFEHGTFAEALAKAKAGKKMVFMDCYTTWCGPCKMMAKDVFPKDEVGQYMNSAFVSLKIDMEKGEGIELAKTYEVKAYPTLLFLDADGKVIHRVVGGLQDKEFVENAKITFDPSKQLGYIESQYNAGKRDFATVASYVKALNSAYKPDQMKKVAADYLPKLTKEQYLTEDGFFILFAAGVEYKSEPFEYVLKNKEAFIAKEYIGQRDYDYFMSGIIGNYLEKIAATKSLDELNKAIKETAKDYAFPNPEQVYAYYRGQYFIANKDFNGWFDLNKKAADEMAQKDKKMAIGMYINTAYKVAVDPSFANSGLYQKAIDMVEGLRSIDPEFKSGSYCLATLYLKTKNKPKALENLEYYRKVTDVAGTAPDARVTKLKTEIESL